MAKATFTAKHFHDEQAAFSYLEARLWPEGPVCPKCGGEGYPLTGVKDKKGRIRLGLKKCRACRAQFTVRMGTVFEASHVPLHLWLQAVALVAASKKGISANQLHRTLGVTLKTAWFMGHRIREAMRSGALAPFGSNGGIVEVDETYTGPKRSRGAWHGRLYPILTLVDRNSGAARSFHIERADKETILPILRANLDKEARVITDDSGVYRNLDAEYSHAFVVHSKNQWGRGEIHTNTIEGFYSIFKRGMRGVYQHCDKKHLHRYAAEFDFRYSNRIALGIDDQARLGLILDGAKGKRLTYKAADSQPREAAN